ncbi:MAG: SDR family NAD(P)-dependent oxidoreductase [Thermomicrobiales bacterium]
MAADMIKELAGRPRRIGDRRSCAHRARTGTGPGRRRGEGGHLRAQRRGLEATKRTIVEQGGDAAAFPAELGELSRVQPLVDGVIAHYGQIDILLNCAGMNQREPIAQVKPETYERIMNVNPQRLLPQSGRCSPTCLRAAAAK